MQQELRETKGKLEQLDVKITGLSKDLSMLGTNVRTVLVVLQQFFPVAFNTKTGNDRTDPYACQDEPSTDANDTSGGRDSDDPDDCPSVGQNHSTTGPYDDEDLCPTMEARTLNGVSVEGPHRDGRQRFDRPCLTGSGIEAARSLRKCSLDDTRLPQDASLSDESNPVPGRVGPGGPRKASLPVCSELARRELDVRDPVKSGDEDPAANVRGQSTSHILMQSTMQQPVGSWSTVGLNRLVRLNRVGVEPPSGFQRCLPPTQGNCGAGEAENQGSSKSLRFLTTDL